MTINEYQKLAMRTATNKCLEIANAGLGLAGEAGECADLIKKYIYHGHPFNKEELIKELGDVAWYIALTCTILNIDMENIFIENIEKLKQRYPEGFSVEKSINRNEGDI